MERHAFGLEVNCDNGIAGIEPRTRVTVADRAVPPPRAMPASGSREAPAKDPLDLCERDSYGRGRSLF